MKCELSNKHNLKSSVQIIGIVIKEKIKYFQISVLLIFLTYLTAFTQQEMRFEHITVRDGLPENSVIRILQDYQGFLWFATQSGPVKYDGYRFTFYSPNPADSQVMPWVFSLYEDKSKNLWMGTKFGLSRYNREKNCLENFSLGNDQYLIYSICDDDYGYLYFGAAVSESGQGLYKFDKVNKSYTKFLHNPADSNSIGGNFIIDVYKEDSTTLWVGGIGGLDKFDLKTGIFKRYKNIFVNPNSTGINIVTKIYKDREENIWIGTTQGLYKFNKFTETLTFCSITPEDSTDIKSHNITDIYEDEYGNLWISIFNYGLVKFEPDSGTSVKYKHDPKISSSLNGNNLYDIFEDRSGILWVGSIWAGLNKYDRQKSRFMHINNNYTGIGGAILEDSSGAIWVGMSNGLSKYDRKTKTFTDLDKITGGKNRLTSKEVYSLLIDSKGYFWIGTRDGLNKFDTKKNILTRYVHNVRDTNSISDNWVRDIYEDSRGNLWIGTENGLHIFDRRNETFKAYHYNVKDPNITPPSINYIYEDRKGDLWIGDNLQGLYKFNRENESFSRYCYSKLGFATITSICEDKKGRFWTGTFNAGIKLFDRNTGAITDLYEKDGLLNNQIYSILEDNSGNLWMGTQYGLSRLNPETGKIKNFDKNDLPVTNFFLNTCMKDKDGYLYFGGEGGIIMFHPDSLEENTIPPPVVLTDFRVFNKSLQPSDNSPLEKNINIAEEINLTYKENKFSIEFAALDYHNPMRNQYAYKLEGFNKDWVQTDASNRIANYTNLDPGEYTFRVKGSNNDGVWNEEGASIRIIITPPWWATWWFRTITIFAVAGIFGGSVRYVTIQRYKRRLALEKERARISKDMHDEVGSSLSKISILSELTKQNISNPEIARTNVDKISESASEVVDNISEIIWAINPKNDSLDNLLAYIREYSAETLELKSIEYKIELPENIPAYNLSAEVRRNIFLVIKEALNNIIKYANATLVNITVKLKESRLEISIKDNGTGFDVNNTRKFGNGLINMRKRIEDIGGEFKLDSESGKGTEIRFSIKPGK